MTGQILFTGGMQVTYVGRWATEKVMRMVHGDSLVPAQRGPWLLAFATLCDWTHFCLTDRSFLPMSQLADRRRSRRPVSEPGCADSQ
jgi:hypothetical protein